MLDRVLDQQMTLQQVKSDPVFDALHGEARFSALVQRTPRTRGE